MVQRLEKQVRGIKHEEPRRIDGAGLRLKQWWSYVLSAHKSKISAWEASLLSRYKLTRLTDVAKMRQPIKPAPNVTWYR
jgi:hypothetical protein